MASGYDGPSESDADPSDAVKRYLGLALGQLEDFHTTYFKQEAEKQRVKGGGETSINLPTNQVLNWPSTMLQFNAAAYIPGRPQQYASFKTNKDGTDSNPVSVQSHYMDFVARLPEDGETLIQDLEVKCGGMDFVNVNDYWLIAKAMELYLGHDELNKKNVEQGTSVAATDAVDDPVDRMGRPLTAYKKLNLPQGRTQEGLSTFVFDDSCINGTVGGVGLLPNYSDATSSPFEESMDLRYKQYEVTYPDNKDPDTFYRPDGDQKLWQGSEWYPRPGTNENHPLGAGGNRKSRMQVYDQKQTGTVFNITSLKTIFNQMYPAIMDLSTLNNVQVRIRFRPATSCIPVSRVRDSYYNQHNGQTYYFHARSLFSDINGGTDDNTRVKYKAANGQLYPAFDNSRDKEKTRESPPAPAYEVTDIALVYETVSMNSPLYARQVEQLANNGTLEYQFKNFYNYTTIHNGTSGTGLNTQCLDAVYCMMQDPEVDAPAPPVQMYNDRVIARSSRFSNFGIDSWQMQVNQASFPKDPAHPADAFHYFYDGAALGMSYLDSINDFLDYKYIMKTRLHFPFVNERLLTGLDIRGINTQIRFLTKLNGRIMHEVADPEGLKLSGAATVADVENYEFEDMRNRRGEFYAAVNYTNNEDAVMSTNASPMTDVKQIDHLASSQLKDDQLSTKIKRERKHVYPKQYNEVLLHMLFEMTSTLRIGAGRMAEVIH